MTLSHPPQQITRRPTFVPPLPRIMEEEEKRNSLEFYSAFELLRPQKASTVELLQRLNSVKFSKEAVVDFLRDKVKENRVLQQRFIEERHQMLGFDLAAAHFIIARGGRVRFQVSLLGFSVVISCLPCSPLVFSLSGKRQRFICTLKYSSFRCGMS